MDKRFVVGMTLTVAWIGLGIYLCISRGLPDQLNAVGDFLSGFFSPLAFLWLVIGYRQQAEELKNSRKALELQAAELHESVKQQVALVNLGKDQLNHEKEVIKQERAERMLASLPIFKLVLVGRFRSNDEVLTAVELRNHGARVTDLRFRAWQDDVLQVDTSIDTYENNSRQKVLNCKDSDNFIVQIDYIDSLGIKRWDRYRFTVLGDFASLEMLQGPSKALI